MYIYKRYAEKTLDSGHTENKLEKVWRWVRKPNDHAFYCCWYGVPLCKWKLE